MKSSSSSNLTKSRPNGVISGEPAHLSNTSLHDGASIEAFVRNALSNGASEGNADALVELYRRLSERVETLERHLKAHHSDKALHDSAVESRYQQMLSAITDYTFTVMVQNGVPVHTQHSANCIAVTGYEAHEYENNSILWYDMIFPADRELALSQARRILHEHKAESVEHRIIRKDGEVRWVKNTPVLHFATTGELVAYDGLVTDITERKQAEEAMRESEERFRFIIEQSPIGIALTTPQGRILKANATICSMLGFSEHEITRLSTQDISLAEDFAKEEEPLRKMLLGEINHLEIEKRFVAKTGEIVWGNVHSSFLRDRDGKPLVRIAIVENITPRKHAETALRQSEERLRALMQNANDAVVISDSDGNFTYCSPSVARMFYYGPERMLTTNAYSYIHPDDLPRVKESFRELIEHPTNSMKTMQYRFRRADGSWAELEAVSTNLLKHPVIQGIVTNARDISKRHRDGQDTDED